MRYIWLGFVGRQSSRHTPCMPRCRWPNTANHLHLFERSLLACLLTAVMFYSLMYEEFWEPCTDSFHVQCSHLIQWYSLGPMVASHVLLMPFLRRRLNRHFNCLDTKSLVYHDSAYVRSFSLFVYVFYDCNSYFCS